MCGCGKAISGKSLSEHKFSAKTRGAKMAKVSVTFSNTLTPSDPKDRPVLILGKLANLKKIQFDAVKCKLGTRVDLPTFEASLGTLQTADSCPLWLNCATLAAVPAKATRHNTPSRAHSVSKFVKSHLPGLSDEFVVLVTTRDELFASACAIARVFPEYNMKTSAAPTQAPRTVTVEVVLASGESVSREELDLLDNTAVAVRLSARIVDAPCSAMHTDAFLQEVVTVGNELQLSPLIIRGEELREKGFGGIHGVGKAAVNPPALVVLSHTPAGATTTVAWVGKGIVYDTGGLSMKTKTTMPGMKADCGGAAGILGAFSVAVRSGFRENLHAVFCLAENAVGPKAQRPDDVVTMYSGRTVEVNNTDAEGRLVLGDGVAFAKKDLKADIIVDMATLTGAQGVATGKYHACVLTNDEDWESVAVRAGKVSGDLCHPIPFTPELHFSEFSSPVADMQNSVSDRSNAQPSCAGLFIMSHLGFEWPGVWIHVDMASPVQSGDRATGYGVALLNHMFGSWLKIPLLRDFAPAVPTLAKTGSPGKRAKDANGHPVEDASPSKRIKPA